MEPDAEEDAFVARLRADWAHQYAATAADTADIRPTRMSLLTRFPLDGYSARCPPPVPPVAADWVVAAQ